MKNYLLIPFGNIILSLSVISCSNDNTSTGIDNINEKQVNGTVKKNFYLTKGGYDNIDFTSYENGEKLNLNSIGYV